MDNRPIGFLDSGVGGLTVVRELLRQLPHEDVVYIGDSARAPYGPRPADQIREYTWQMVNFLLTKNVKMIVLACNTATAVVWEEVKEKLDIPVLGVILPGASAAIKSTTHQKIGVIGTPMTVSSGIYKEKIQSLAPDMEVSSLACPKFVPLVESNELASSVTKLLVSLPRYPPSNLNHPLRLFSQLALQSFQLLGGHSLQRSDLSLRLLEALGID